jgi:hypothetical protein
MDKSSIRMPHSFHVSFQIKGQYSPLLTVGFFFLSQPERKVLNSKIETKHYKDFLWIMTVKTPLKTDDFVNLSLKSSPEQKLYRFEN